MSEGHGAGREYLGSALDWPQIRDMFNSRIEESEKALRLQRDADNQRIVDLERVLRGEIQKVEELGEQHHVAQQRALDAAAQERENSADQLRALLIERMDSQNLSLKHHIESQAQQIALRHDAQKEATTLAQANTEKRFESMNDFRAQLRDQAERFLPREIFDAAFSDYQGWREAINSRLDRQSGVSSEMEAIRARIEKQEEESDRRFGALERGATTVRTQMMMVGAFATVIVSVVVVIVNLFFSFQ